MVALERDAPVRDGVARAHGEGARRDPQAVALPQLAREVGQALRLERRLRHLPHPAEQLSLRPAHEEDTAVPLDERGGDGHVHGRAAGPALGQLVDEPLLQPTAVLADGTGGARGLARQADGRPQLHHGLVPVARPLAVEQLLRAVVVRAVAAVLGAAQREEAREDAAHVAVDHRQRPIVGDREDGARRVEPDTGHGEGGLDRVGEPAPVAFRHVLRAPVQVAGAVVVAETGPCRDRLLLGLLGEGGEGREAGEEPLEVRRRGLHRRLLEHHLGDPHRPRLAGAPPRQVAPVALVPGEERPAERGAHVSLSTSAPRPRSFSSMR